MKEPNISVQIHNLCSLLCPPSWIDTSHKSNESLSLTDDHWRHFYRRPDRKWFRGRSRSTQVFRCFFLLGGKTQEIIRDNRRHSRRFFFDKQATVNGSSMLSLHWDANINIGDLPASVVSQQRTNSFIWRFDCRDDEKQTRLRSDSFYVQINSIWTLLNSFIDTLVGIGYTGQDDEAAHAKSRLLFHAIDEDIPESNDDR